MALCILSKDEFGLREARESFVEGLCAAAALSSFTHSLKAHWHFSLTHSERKSVPMLEVQAGPEPSGRYAKSTQPWTLIE